MEPICLLLILFSVVEHMRAEHYEAKYTEERQRTECTDEEMGND